MWKGRTRDWRAARTASPISSLGTSTQSSLCKGLWRLYLEPDTFLGVDDTVMNQPKQSLSLGGVWVVEEGMSTLLGLAHFPILPPLSLRGLVEYYSKTLILISWPRSPPVTINWLGLRPSKGPPS